MRKVLNQHRLLILVSMAIVLFIIIIRGADPAPILKSAYNGDLDSLKILIDGGANVMTEDENGYTALHFAVMSKNYDAVQYLIENGADVNKRTKQDEVPLHFASFSGRIDIVELLINNGADINVKMGNGNTPLMGAADYETAKLLVENGADLKVRNQIDMTPLHAAASKGDTLLIKYYLKKGLDINATDMEYRTPLIVAVNYRFPEAAEILIENGADINKKAKSGNSAVFYAGSLETFKMLIENGADLTFKNEYGADLLHWHSAKGNVDIMKYLLQNTESDINSKDSAGKTPLCIAVQTKKLDAVKFLVENGADLDIKDNEGNTPLDYAVKNKSEKIIKFLKDNNKNGR